MPVTKSQNIHQEPAHGLEMGSIQCIYTQENFPPKHLGTVCHLEKPKWELPNLRFHQFAINGIFVQKRFHNPFPFNVYYFCKCNFINLHNWK